MTKRELVSCLLKGNVSVERAFFVRWYRVSIPSDVDPHRCVLIPLVPVHEYFIGHYDDDHAHAVIRGRQVRLTRMETAAIAARLHNVFGLRGRSNRYLATTATRVARRASHSYIP